MSINKEYVYTSHGITVSAVTKYEAEYSNPELERFIFSYHISISNNGSFPVQLMSRRWEIIDAEGNKRLVEGDGVVGLQPTIEQGESFNYSSWCPLATTIGKMSGYFHMIRLIDNEKLEVKIPDFTLVTPFLQN